MKPIIVFELPEYSDEKDLDRAEGVADELSKGPLKDCVILVVRSCKVKVFQPISLRLIWYRVLLFFGFKKLKVLY